MWHINCYVGCCDLTNQTNTGESMSMLSITAQTLQGKILSATKSATNTRVFPLHEIGATAIFGTS
jgi:hypothetical protein